MASDETLWKESAWPISCCVEMVELSARYAVDDAPSIDEKSGTTSRKRSKWHAATLRIFVCSAQMAVAARKAAKLYVRERTLVPLAIGSELFDGVRQLYKRGSFQPQGLSEEQVWLKYAGVPHPSALLNDCDADAAALDDVFLTVLRKSCTSNQHVDYLAGCASLNAHLEHVIP